MKLLMAFLLAPQTVLPYSHKISPASAQAWFYANRLEKHRQALFNKQTITII